MRALTNLTLEPIACLPAGARALVVDDGKPHIDGCNPLRPGLQSLGLEVFVAPSSERARRVLSGVPVDLLLVDLHPSSNRRTLDWLRSVRADYPDLVLIATADVRNDELERFCEAQGAAAYLTLPASFRTLRRCIERAFTCRQQLLDIRRLERRLEAATGTNVATPDVDHQVDDLWFCIFEQLLRTG